MGIENKKIQREVVEFSGLTEALDNATENQLILQVEDGSRSINQIFIADGSDGGVGTNLSHVKATTLDTNPSHLQDKIAGKHGDIVLVNPSIDNEKVELSLYWEGVVEDANSSHVLSLDSSNGLKKTSQSDFVKNAGDGLSKVSISSGSRIEVDRGITQTFNKIKLTNPDTASNTDKLLTYDNDTDEIHASGLNTIQDVVDCVGQAESNRVSIHNLEANQGKVKTTSAGSLGYLYERISSGEGINLSVVDDKVQISAASASQTSSHVVVMTDVDDSNVTISCSLYLTSVGGVVSIAGTIDAGVVVDKEYIVVGGAEYIPQMEMKFRRMNATTDNEGFFTLKANGNNLTLTVLSKPDDATYYMEALYPAIEQIGIRTLDDLNNVRNNLSGHYILMNDLDFAGSQWGAGGSEAGGWTPIGSDSARFTGTFDGNNNKVSNLYINRPSSRYQGLFEYTIGSTIKDLAVENVNVTGANFTGGLVGYSTHSSTITNCYSTGSVSGDDFVGGLAGVNEVSSTITNCYSTVNVNGSSAVGGLVGENLAGDDTTPSTIINCYSTGSVSGTTKTGGLVGNNTSSTITSSYYDSQTSGKSDTGKGVPKTTAQMKTQSTFTGWDFTTIWQIQENITYPTLR